MVDPSDAAPVADALAKRNLKLTHILNTHHHNDHVGGNLELKEMTGARVVGPGKDRGRIPGIDDGAIEGEILRFGPHDAHVLEIPAHTSSHVAYYFTKACAVFTGDTLFAMGCGRLFEGTPAMMWASLTKLANLPGDTNVYCGHEYTLANIKFAHTIEPDNKALQARAKQAAEQIATGKMTVPTTIDEEKAANVFLRADVPAVAAAVGRAGKPAAEVFTEVRARKNKF